MTDKTASENDSNSSQGKHKGNTITKSTDKSANTSEQISPETKVTVNMSDSTKAVEPKQDNAKATSSTVASKVPGKTHSNKTDRSSKQPTSTMKQESPSKISKLAVLSLFVAIIAVIGVVALYYWHLQQQVALELRLNNAAKTNSINVQAQMKKVLTLQQETLASQVENSVKQMELNTAQRIEQLNVMVEKFSQNQPTDWLVHEAEYLVRVAARTMWLEKDTTAAIALLQDADERITELNNPEVLPVRQLIYQDIETLKSVPVLETESVILSLIALGEQVQSLPLITLSIPLEKAKKEAFVLSDDISDWRENIAKTWDKFLNTFVVVHSRVGDLEPILPVEQRANLKESLSLKLQVAQWAASKGQRELFVKSLNDVETWVIQYFDIDNMKVKAFIKTLRSLENKIIYVEMSNKLQSLQAIRNILADRDISEALIKPAILEEEKKLIPEAKVEDATRVIEAVKKAEDTILESPDESADELINDAAITEKTAAPDNKAMTKEEGA